MSELKLDGNAIRTISLFESMTDTHVKDFVEIVDKVIFVVEKGEGSKAIGKGGDTVTRVRDKLRKNVQIIEFSDDVERFISNIFHAYGVKKIEFEMRGTVKHATVTVDPAEKGKAIGKEGRNLKIARDIVARHFDVKSMNVA